MAYVSFLSVEINHFIISNHHLQCKHENFAPNADTQQVFACHCYENKVGTFRKRAQEIDPEPGRFFRLDYAQAIADVGGLPA